MADRILVVDDDSELCELVAEYLTPEGFTVESVHDGPGGVERGTAGDHAAIVLDVMLPGLGGFEVLRRIRAASSVPIVMLTARGDDLDRIMGLEIGADDYLPKPFNPRELVARIRAVLRRSRHPVAEEPRDLLTVDDVIVDVGARVVKRGGEAVELTAAEHEVLVVLLRAAGTVVSREGLVKRAFGRRLGPYDRGIDMHLSNIRRKLGPHPGGAERIKTVRGVGYAYTRQAV
jgi:two-component system response regulator CpxR